MRGIIVDYHGSECKYKSIGEASRSFKVSRETIIDFARGRKKPSGVLTGYEFYFEKEKK